MLAENTSLSLDITESKKDIAVIGAGCAGLSLAAKANELPSAKIHIITPPHHAHADHVWGFWAMDWLNQVRPLVRKSWHKWSIVNEQTNHVMHSDHHPYQAISRHQWLAQCRDQATMHGVNFQINMMQRRPPIGQYFKQLLFLTFEVCQSLIKVT